LGANVIAISLSFDWHRFDDALNTPTVPAVNIKANLKNLHLPRFGLSVGHEPPADPHLPGDHDVVHHVGRGA
jgi:hypothetical protein